MPTTYTHYRMGQTVRRKVSKEISGVIEKDLDLFQIGLHGPDILFYYHALKNNPVIRQGNAIHDKPGMVFFQKAIELIKKHPDNPAYRAYAYGVLCHFALDVTCHGYIEEQIPKIGVDHLAIEAELDREFLIRDGKNPLSQILTKHIKPSIQVAQVICEFYEDLYAEDIQTSLKWMVFCLSRLVCPTSFQRNLILFLLKIVGAYNSKQGLIIREEKIAACADTIEELVKLYEKAEPLAISLVNSFDRFVEGKEPMPDIFQYDFGGQLVHTN